MTNYNDEDWHVHRGGECPVHEKTQVDITYAHGTAYLDDPAGWYDWDRPLMFRVVKEHKEPREFWVDPDRCIAVESYHAGFIHVREVTE